MPTLLTCLFISATLTALVHGASRAGYGVAVLSILTCRVRFSLRLVSELVLSPEDDAFLIVISVLDTQVGRRQKALPPISVIGDSSHSKPRALM